MDRDEIVACVTILLAAEKLVTKKRKERKIWMRTWLADREIKGAYNNILQELRLQAVLTDTDTFEVISKFNFNFFVFVVFDTLWYSPPSFFSLRAVSRLGTPINFNLIIVNNQGGCNKSAVCACARAA